MRYVTAALVVAVLFLSMQLHTAKERIAVLEDRSTCLLYTSDAADD